MKHIQKKSSNNQYYTENIIEAFPPCLVLSSEGIVTRLNDAACDLLNYKQQEIAGNPITELIGDTVLKEKMDQTGTFDLFNQDEYTSFESIFLSKEGKKIPVLLTSSLILDDLGEPDQIVCVVIDLTNKKKAEQEQSDLEMRLEQSQKMEAIGTLASGIAHDFNNIISTIRGFTELLENHKERDKKESEYLNTIANCSDRASELVKQILVFSQNNDSKFAKLQLSPLIEGTIKLMRAVFPASVEIISIIQESDINIEGNAIQIHQILVELFNNARIALKAKGGHLEIRLSETDQQLVSLPKELEKTQFRYAQITIAFNAGSSFQEIKNEVVDASFDSTAIPPELNATVSKVHKLVKNHKGMMVLNCRPEANTEISLYFPILSKDTTTAAKDGKEQAQDGFGHIMLVEDEVSLSKYYKIALSKLGYQTTAFTCPLEALDAFKNNPDKFSLIFTDMSMPKMTGLELCRQILGFRPSIPIIMSSGNQTFEQQEEAKSIGVEHFLLKPVNFVNLSKLLKSILIDSESKAKAPEKPTDIESSKESLEKESMSSEFESIFDEEFIASILPQFYKDRGLDAEHLMTALKENNYQQVYDIGHKIKGSAQTFGYKKYTALGEALQSAAKDENSTAIQTNVDKLLNYLIEDHTKLNR